jgi:hypothetical protein
MMRLRLAAVLLFCSLSAGAQQLNIITEITQPADPRPGAERQVSIIFRNHDTRTATNVVVTVSNFTAHIVDITGLGWLCEEPARRSSVTCRRNRIAPGEITALSARITISQLNPVGQTIVAIRSDEPVRQPDVFPTYPITQTPPLTDLGVSVTTREEVLQGRQALSLIAAVTNRGPAAAPDVVLRFSAEEALPPLDASGPRWTCRTVGFDTTCTRPSLAAGETSTVEFRHYVSFEQEADAGFFLLSFPGADANPFDNQLYFRVSASIPPPPDPADFEPVLLPIALTDIQGAFGSLWRTHFTLYNGNGVPLIGLGSFDLVYPFYSGCLFPICPSPEAIPPRTSASLFIRQPGGPPGVLLWVRKDRIANVDFELRVQDMSRQALTWGTEILVVREKDLRAAPFRLLNVPLDERFRQSLRIYDVSAGATAAVLVRFIDADVGRVMHEQVLGFPAQPVPPFGVFQQFRLLPGYTEIGWVASLPELRDSGRVHIEVVPLAPEQRLWAFVSVTNNETQHVTTISPQ